MLAAVKNYDPADGASFTTYYYRVVQRRLWQCIRRDPGHESLDEPLFDDEDATMMDTIPSPYQENDPVLSEDVQRLLDGIDKEDRQLLILAAVYGESIAEAATRLGINEKEARNRLNRVKNHLFKKAQRLQLLNEYAWRPTSLAAFNSTMTSSV